MAEKYNVLLSILTQNSEIQKKNHENRAQFSNWIDSSYLHIRIPTTIWHNLSSSRTKHFYRRCFRDHSNLHHSFFVSKWQFCIELSTRLLVFPTHWTTDFRLFWTVLKKVNKNSCDKNDDNNRLIGYPCET